MQVLSERCCGLDVPKASVVACLVTPGPRGGPTKAVRTFGTMTDELLRLADWLTAAGCTHVAMESTGVYWVPLWHLLEARFALLLVNAAHVKQVPGRKTDVADAEWLADPSWPSGQALLRHGLLRASFVPPQAQRELRELTRYRAELVAARTAEVNRLQQTLEGANRKLGSVLSDVMGVSGRAILAALLAGERDAARLAALAVGKLRAKPPDPEQALAGRVGDHHRLLLRHRLTHIDGLDAQLAELDAAIAERLADQADVLERLDEIPGVGRRTAEGLVAEVGTDMARFPSAAHCASWAGLCPGHDQSAGKRRSGKTRQGNRALRAALTEAAKAAGRTKHAALGQRYRRLRQRLGTKKATVALARHILEVAYHLIRDGSRYQEPVPPPRGPLARQLEERRHVQALRQLGYHVTLQPTAA
jgi:transposase